jgi:hypothetical protein
MQVLSIRERLHQYVDKSDEKLIKLLYALAKEYNDDDDFEYEFTAEDIQLFDERRKKRLLGESNTYSWQRDSQEPGGGRVGSPD